MTDLHHFLTPTALSSFHQLPLQLRRHRITTNELLTWDATKVAKRCHVSPLAINKLKKAVLAVCGHDLGVLSKLSGDANPNANAPLPTPPGSVRKAGSLRQTGEELERKWRTISLLDPGLDKVMNGGVGVGQITEICGESGAGKTQLLLTLLLSVQLPAPHGPSKSALYLSTEGSLPTQRLHQLLASHPLISSLSYDLPKSQRPSLDRIYTACANTLEHQKDLLTHQVPKLLDRGDIGLIVLDSLTGNYRDAFSDPRFDFRENMKRRALEMRKLGKLLRSFAERGVAVVVVNQVSDRFRAEDRGALWQKDGQLGPNATPQVPSSSWHPQNTQETPMPKRRRLDDTETAPAPIQFNLAPPPLPSQLPPFSQINHFSTQEPFTPETPKANPLSFDVQEPFLTGSAPIPHVPVIRSSSLKNPWGGYPWTQQLSARIVLIKQSTRSTEGGLGIAETGLEAGASNIWTGSMWRRWINVVFCAWAPQGICEYRITEGGVETVGEAVNLNPQVYSQSLSQDGGQNAEKGRDSREGVVELVPMRFEDWEANDELSQAALDLQTLEEEETEDALLEPLPQAERQARPSAAPTEADEEPAKSYSNSFETAKTTLQKETSASQSQVEEQPILSSPFAVRTLPHTQSQNEEQETEPILSSPLPLRTHPSNSPTKADPQQRAATSPSIRTIRTEIPDSQEGSEFSLSPISSHPPHTGSPRPSMGIREQLEVFSQNRGSEDLNPRNYDEEEVEDEEREIFNQIRDEIEQSHYDLSPEPGPEPEPPFEEEEQLPPVKEREDVREGVGAGGERQRTVVGSETDYDAALGWED